MKLTSLVFPILLAAASLSGAQDISRPDSTETSKPLTSQPGVRILGKIADGAPPTPTPPKPRYSIDPRDVRKVTTHQQGGRTITIREINPIDLPKPPTPKATTLTEADTTFSQELLDLKNHKSGFLMLGATVYRSEDAPARALVRCWSGRGGEPMTFWSSADFSLIAGGFHSYVDSAGATYHLLMACGDSPAEEAPPIPEFETDHAQFQTVGQEPAEHLLVAIESLHELYDKKYDQLKRAQEGRKQARIEREAYLRANPPQPKDITLNFWRTEHPAAKAEGGDQ